MTTTANSPVEGSAEIPSVDRLAPSIPAIFFICVSLLASFAAQRQLVNGDGDLARHLRHGIYMLQHHALILHDPFSFTRAGQPFVPFEYGSQLLYAAIYKLAGLAGVTVLAGTLIGATYALLARLLLRRGVDPFLVILAVGAAVLLGFPHWIARPHIISWVLIVSCFGLVEYNERPPIWIYPTLFALWANLHGGWLYGVALLGLYLVGSLIEYSVFGRKPEDLAQSRHFAVALGLAVGATLLTPMGVGLWRHVYAHLGDTYVLTHTKEFKSPDFESWPAKVLLLILLGSVGMLIVSRRRVHTTRLLVSLCGVWWALTSVRNLALFGLTGVAVVALHLDKEWREIPWLWLQRHRYAFAAGALRANTAGWVMVTVTAFAVLAANGGTVFGQSLITNKFDSQIFPVAAAEKARSEHLDGKLFSDFTWGGYVLFAWPEQRVFIDGGTDFYGETIMKDYVNVSALEPGWRDVLDRWKVDLVLTRSTNKLAQEIVRTPGWVIWYCDSVSLLARRSQDTSTTQLPDSAAAELLRCSHTPSVRAD